MALSLILCNIVSLGTNVLTFLTQGYQSPIFAHPPPNQNSKHSQAKIPASSLHTPSHEDLNQFMPSPPLFPPLVHSCQLLLPVIFSYTHISMSKLLSLASRSLIKYTILHYQPTYLLCNNLLFFFLKKSTEIVPWYYFFFYNSNTVFHFLIP